MQYGAFQFREANMVRTTFVLFVTAICGCVQEESANLPDPPDSGAQVIETETLVIAVADDGTRSEVRQTVNGARLAGRYFSGDGTSCNLDLNLRHDGTFEVVWTGCLGVYGTCAGVWSIDDKGVATTVTRAEGMYERRGFDKLQLATLNGHYLLVQESFRDLFDKYPPSHGSCFHQLAAEPALDAAFKRWLNRRLPDDEAIDDKEK